MREPYPGTLASVVVGIEDLIAMSPTFNSLTDPADARDRIHLYADESDLVQDKLSRPHAIMLPTQSIMARRSEGCMSDQRHTLTVLFALDGNPDAENSRASFLEFLDDVGRIVLEIGERAGVGNSWAISTIMMVKKPWRVPRKERGDSRDFWCMAYDITVSTEG